MTAYTEQKSYKDKPFAVRQKETCKILQEYPNRIPIIVEKLASEKHLPMLDKRKFLVPNHVTLGDFQRIIRRRLHLSESQAFFLLVNQRALPAMFTPLCDIYDQEKDDDNYLYMVYASQEAFGGQ